MQDALTAINNHQSRHKAVSGDLPPSILNECIKRIDANVPDDYLEWAESFALLKEQVIAHFAKRVPRLGLSELLRRGWQPAPNIPNCYIGDGGIDRELYIAEYDKRWVVELQDYSMEHRGGRILTFCYFAQWPVLCPSPESAAQLAAACIPDPDPKTRLWWRSYW
jgi:hypothetical protein